MCVKMRILSNIAKFSADRPLFTACNFSATMASTYSTHHLGAVASLKFLAIENVSPLFDPCLLWPNGWMDQDTTLYGGRRLPRRHCVRWGPSSSDGKGQSSHPLFCPLLWPTSPQARILPITRTIYGFDSGSSEMVLFDFKVQDGGRSLLLLDISSARVDPLCHV